MILQNSLRSLQYARCKIILRIVNVRAGFDMENAEQGEHINGRAKRPLTIRVGKKLRNSINSICTSQSRIPVASILSEKLLPWTSMLGDQWHEIAHEAEQILKFREAIPPLKDISPDHARIAGDGNWRSFFLIGYGYEVAENCARAPLTAALVKQIPDLNSAFFSILAPGAKIPLHRGVTRGLVTCHLGLKVPEDAENCWMNVEDEKVYWENGKWIVFDDSYRHEVENNTEETRIILLIQVKRPMRALGTVLNNATLWGIRRSSFVQDARQNLSDWETVFQKMEKNETV